MIIKPEALSCAFKRRGAPADTESVSNEARLPIKAGPVPDRLTIWPVDDGRYAWTRPSREPPGTSGPSTTGPSWTAKPFGIRSIKNSATHGRCGSDRSKRSSLRLLSQRSSTEHISRRSRVYYENSGADRAGVVFQHEANVPTRCCRDLSRRMPGGVRRPGAQRSGLRRRQALWNPGQPMLYRAFRVTVTGPTAHVVARSHSPNGRFSFDLVPGVYTVSADVKGHVIGKVSVHAAASQTTNANITNRNVQ